MGMKHITWLAILAAFPREVKFAIIWTVSIGVGDLG